MKSLEIKNLKKSFKRGLFEKPKLVLKDLSFSVSSQKTTGFIGVNGSGKTTTLKCVLDFIRPEAGEISFFDNQTISNEVKARIGYLPERPYYYEYLTALEFLYFHWNLSATKEDTQGKFLEQSHEVLTKVNLLHAKDQRLRSFSKGMLQRAGLAQAILRKPDFLILDEPMSGLDPDGRILIKDIIREEQKRGTAIFFSSHLLGDMDELCDDLVVIDQGQLIYQGSLKDFAKGEGVEKSFRTLRAQLGVNK